jgi:hypothetical protein
MGGRLAPLQRLLFYVPALVLVIAFIGVCLQAGTPWPWNRVVHEDGHRTLLQTVFYFEHATRELLLDVVLALAVAGAVRYFFPVRRDVDDASLERVRRWIAVAATLTLVAIVGGTAVTDGGQAIVDNLAQYHTRESGPLVWGAHWRYHFIERIADIALAFALAGVLWIVAGRPGDGGARGVSLMVAAIIVFRRSDARLPSNDGTVPRSDVHRPSAARASDARAGDGAARCRNMRAARSAFRCRFVRSAFDEKRCTCLRGRRSECRLRRVPADCSRAAQVAQLRSEDEPRRAHLSAFLRA